MKKHIALLLCFCLSITFVFYGVKYIRSTDEYLRNSIYLLKSDKGSCTGVSVRAPSGATYLMSAAHCAMLANGSNKIQAISEAGNSYFVTVILVDKKHDLMLMSAAEWNGLSVASSAKVHQKVKSLTHGHGFPTHRSEGELLSIIDIDVMAYSITDETELNQCIVDGFSAYPTPFGRYCIMRLNMQMTTAFVSPGSSGGPMFNMDGELIGIVSCSEGMFSGIVPLKIIKEMLKNR